MLVKQKDKFLSKSFNTIFYNLFIDFKNIDLKKLELEIESFDKDSTYSVSIAKGIDIFDILENTLLLKKFVKVGTLYTYEILVDQLNFSIDFKLFNIRFANLHDIEKLKKIAFSSFLDDRFHQDTKIDKLLSDNYYSSWIENSVKIYNDFVILIEGKSCIEGFISYRVNYKEKTSSILLNAIDSNYRNGGRYSALLFFLLEHLRRINIKKLTIGTYENSIGVHKTMKKFGFNLSSVKSIYHLHTEK